MNVHDSEKVVGTLLAKGYRQVETPEAAALVLYNTCSIRDKAEQKVFSRLQQFKREAGKGKLFGVLGCVAQQEGERIFEKAPHVSLVAGSASYTKLGELLVRLEAGERRVTGLSLDTEETFETPLTARDNPHRAYITIIEGCDKSCAYCVVPFTRGPERSRTSRRRSGRGAAPGGPGLHRDPVARAERQQLSRPLSGGLGFRPTAGRRGRSPGHPPRALHHFAPARFRQADRGRHGRPSGNLQPRPPARAVRLHAACSPQCNASTPGKNTWSASRWLKASPRNISITTDIIVGFPGETEADFLETMDLLDTVGYDSLFSFKYSPRPNTASLAMDDRIPEDEKTRRLMALNEKQRAMQIRRNAALVGSVEEVLVEGRNQSLGQWIGRTSQNRTLNFTHPGLDGGSLLGTYLNVRVTRSGPNSLVGEAC